MALLAGLDDVPWSRLQHAYGPATDVPELLRALVDPDGAPTALKQAARKQGRSVFELAEWTLWGNVFHQGTVYQASAPTIPFLVEILRDGPPDRPLRQFLISYLHHLALGYPEDLFPRRIDRARDFAKYPAGRDCHAAVERALPAILPFARDADEAIALEAIALAASFAGGAEVASPVLREILTTATAMRAGTAVVALAQLCGRAARDDAERAAASTDPLLAIHGACASVLADADRVSERSLVLLTTLEEMTAQRRTPLTESVSALVGRCVARLPPAHHERAVDALAQQLVAANAMARLSLTGSLLSIAFGPTLRAPARAVELTPPQLRALEAIRDHGAWTLGGDGTFVNFTELLRGCRLPDDRDALARWLRG